MGQISNGAFYVHNDGFTILQHESKGLELLHTLLHDKKVNNKSSKGELITVKSHAYRVQFLQANAKAQIIPDKPIPSYNNYFTGDDPSKWAEYCRIFQGITIKNIYPNIDVRYYSDKGAMKYDIIVHPGGNVADIALKYEGADNLNNKVFRSGVIFKTMPSWLSDLVA